LENFPFEADRDYVDVYFLVVDTKSHSDIVAANDADQVVRAFDELEKMVFTSVERERDKKKSQVAQFWGWQGDGGLCIIYDKEASRARETAIAAGKEILAEIPGLNDRIKRMEVTGEFHLRMALHKGSLRYRGDEKRGSVHSKDLNLTSHLQQFVPADTLAITEEIFKVSGPSKTEFFEAGTFDGQKIFLHTKRPSEDALTEWRTNIQGKAGQSFDLETDVPPSEFGLVGVFSQRANTKEYFEAATNAKNAIWVLGVGLGGFQSDLGRTLREKAREGIDIRLLVADPNIMVSIDGKKTPLPLWRDRDVGGGDYHASNISNLVKLVQDINGALKKEGKESLVKLKFSKSIPTVAIMRVDRTVYLSPHLVRQQGLKSFLFKFESGGRLYDQSIKHFESIWNESKYSRDALG
jgi:hypothetical protein